MKVYKKGKDGWLDETDETVLTEYDPILEAMGDASIFGINYYADDKKFVIYERCDEYFATDLTAEMCDDLAKMFSGIAREIKAKQ